MKKLVVRFVPTGGGDGMRYFQTNDRSDRPGGAYLLLGSGLLLGGGLLLGRMRVGEENTRKSEFEGSGGSRRIRWMRIFIYWDER